MLDGSDKQIVASLEKKVQNLEVWFRTVAIVAGIFGLGGTWGWVAFKSAQEEISALKEQIKDVKTARDTAISMIEQKAKDVTLDISHNVNSMVSQSISAQLDQKISALKQWTTRVYQSARYNEQIGTSADGNWQRDLRDHASAVEQDLR